MILLLFPNDAIDNCCNENWKPCFYLEDGEVKQKEFIAKEGYNPMYGARPLRRAIQKHIENPLSEELIHGRFVEDNIIQIDCKDDKLIFKELYNNTKEAKKAE